MKIKELRQILERIDLYHDEEEVTVLLDLPSIGPRACTKVKDVQLGFDWDKGLQIRTEARIAIKNSKQDIYESAYELLAWLATKPVKKQSYEIRTAHRILQRNGHDQERFEMLRRVFHKDIVT